MWLIKKNIIWEKKPTFRKATTGFPANWRENLLQPIGSTTQIWVVTSRPRNISRRWVRGETSDGVAKCCLFSQTKWMDEFNLTWKKEGINTVIRVKELVYF